MKIDFKKLVKRKEFKKVVLAFYLFLLLISFYHIILAKRIIWGVKVGNVDIGGLTYDSAISKLEEKEKSVEKVLKFNHEDKTYSIYADDIKLTYDWDASVSRAFEIGRSGSIFFDTKNKLLGLARQMYIPAFYDYEDNILSLKFAEIQGEVNQKAENARMVVENGDILVVEAKNGIKVYEEGFYKVVTEAFDRMSFGNKTLPVGVEKPQINEDDLTPFISEVRKLVFNNFYVYYDNYKWEFSPTELLDFISFNKGKSGVEMSINDAKLESLVELIVQSVGKLPRGQVTRTEGKRVIDFKVIEEGREVNEKVLVEDFKNAFFEAKPSVLVPVKIISGPTEKEKYGIYALLGEGRSKFTGSAPSRVRNLSLAAQRTNGVLVPPGEVYSMGNAVGEISRETGYDMAYVISGGRTVLGSGGGVCQTSTTLFRAVLNSGLPVVMRYPHDYRVRYYEIEGKVGFDASVYLPSIDFKFKNDTPNYILVQSEVIPSEDLIVFRIYGTPDGREVKITDPVVTNVTPPPAPLYQDDPTLAKGVVKQVDFPAWGATASFTRTVTIGDRILFEDTYTTRYQPWRAIYLVGTKEN